MIPGGLVEPKRWFPPEGLRGHSGEAIPEDAIFFAEPPPSIGCIESAGTTLRARDRAAGWRWKLFLASLPVFGIYVLLAGAAAASDLADGIQSLNWSHVTDPVPMIAAALFGIPAGVFIWRRIKFERRCDYIGEDGVAIATMTSANQIRMESVRFEFVLSVEESLKDFHYRFFHVIPVYVNTHFAFRWIGLDHGCLLILDGSVRKDAWNPRPGHPYLFAVEARRRCSAYQLFQRVPLDES